MDSKKKCLVASEADAPRIRDLRAKWDEWAPTVDPRRLVFVDEAGSTISMTRTHARAKRGQRTRDSVPRNRGTVTTMLGAIRLDGLGAMMTIEGGTDGDVYAAFLEEILAPTLRPGDLVVMDNAGAHKDPRVDEILKRHGAKAIYLPPYSPELNPIELAWSKLKSALRRAKARTVEALNGVIASAMKSITPADCMGWFRHCGYQTVQLT